MTDAASRTSVGSGSGRNGGTLMKASSITVVDRFGEEYMLHLEGNYGSFTPSHLREHMVAAMPIYVEYVVMDHKWNVIAIYDDSDSNQHE